MTEAMYGALMVDLDGTLIDRAGRISPRTAQAVSTAADVINVSILSGREVAHVRRYALELGLDTPQVSDGGSHVFDSVKGETIWTAFLGAAHSQVIADAIRSAGAAYFATHPGGTIREFEQASSHDLIRISALDMDETTADHLAALAGDGARFHAVKAYLPYNGLWAVDFTAPGVTKATGLRKVAELLDIETPQTIAAGDSYNDLPMLREAGLRIAMGDSPQELHDVADYVAPSAEADGLAVAIEEFVMPLLDRSRGP